MLFYKHFAVRRKGNRSCVLFCGPLNRASLNPCALCSNRQQWEAPASTLSSAEDAEGEEDILIVEDNPWIPLGPAVALITVAAITFDILAVPSLQPHLPNSPDQTAGHGNMANFNHPITTTLSHVISTIVN